MDDLLFNRVGKKMTILERKGFRRKTTRKEWQPRTFGIRHEYGDKEVGPCDETIRNWVSRELPGSLHSVEGMCRVLNEQSDIGIELTPVLISDTTSEADFFVALGGTATAYFQMESAMWGDQHFPGPDFAVDRAQPLATLERAYSGLYIGSRSSGANGSRKARSELRLAIGWGAPISTRKNERRRYLPCRLTVESPKGGRRFGYRGAFSDRSPVRVYVFHQDDSPDPDMVVMMTGKSDTRTRPPVDGYMVTATEGPSIKPVTYDVQLKWSGALGSLAEMEAFLNGEGSGKAA
jgi:hypothetical protein